MEAKILNWEELKSAVGEAEAEGFSNNNGSGRVYADYYVFYRNGKVFDWHSDAMEPEDARFSRDLNWIGSLVLRAYEQGLEDAIPKII